MFEGVGRLQRERGGRSVRCRGCASELPTGWPSELCATCLRIWEETHLPRAEWRVDSSTQWFVGRDLRQLGPYRFTAVQRLAGRGKLRPDDLVWTEGMAGWKRADLIEGLLPSSVAGPVAGKPQRAAKVPAAVRPNYFVRHWRGDLSLPLAYWVNWLVVSVLLAVAVLGATQPGLLDRLGVRGAGPWAIAVLAVAFMVAVWQSVGLWRSAGRYVARGGRSEWATLARVCVGLGLLRLAASGVEQFPMVQQTLGAALHGEPTRVAQLHVVNHGMEVEIAGGLSPGTTAALKSVLDTTPTIRVVRLGNTGGWISEGHAVGKLIEARALATFAARECDSACLLAFLSGKERYLGSKGRLGFYAASATGIGGGGAAERRNELFRQALLARGVPSAFIDQALSGSATSAWYPTAQELLHAHVITAVVDEPEYVLNRVDSRARLEADFATVPVFAVLRRLEPATFEQLEETYVSGVLAGMSQNEMSAKAHATIMEKVIPKYVRIAPDHELVAYWETQLEKARELRAIDPKYCAQFLAPQPGADTSKLASLFSAKVQAADVQALANLMRAGAGHPEGAPSGSAVRSALRESARRAEQLMPGAVQIVANPDTAASKPAEFCSAEVTFYESILALPTHQAGPLLRFLVAQG